jgi:hypothetical protein
MNGVGRRSGREQAGPRAQMTDGSDPHRIICAGCDGRYDAEGEGRGNKLGVGESESVVDHAHDVL